MSRKALEKFSKKLMNDPKACRPRGAAEDAEMGHCMQHSAIFVDCRDKLHQKRFFPVSLGQHYMNFSERFNAWYQKNTYYPAAKASLNCCSDTLVALHYQNQRELFWNSYSIYQVNLFGVNAHINDKYPEKLPLQEVIDASDVAPVNSNLSRRVIRHELEDSEKY